MANAARGEVVLELGGRRYALRPSFGAVCEIEDAIGTSLYEIGRRLERAEVSARELVGFAQACLEQNGQAFERAALGELIVAEGTHKTIATLTEFCRSYAFGGRPEKKAEPKPQARVRETNGSTPS